MLIVLHWVVALSCEDKVGGNQLRALVQELVERMLGVGRRLAEKNRPCGVLDVIAGSSNGFAVGLHGQLLQIGREAVHVLIEWRDQVGLGTEEVGVPYAEQAADDGDVLLEGRLPEMFVHCVSTRKELMEVVEANVKGNAEAYGTPDTVATANPALEAKHVFLVDAEFGHFLHIR